MSDTPRVRFTDHFEGTNHSGVLPDDGRCPCGCTMVWDQGEHGWHCPHCDLPPGEQLDALLDHLPLSKVRG